MLIRSCGAASVTMARQSGDRPSRMLRWRWSQMNPHHTAHGAISPLHVGNCIFLQTARRIRILRIMWVPSRVVTACDITDGETSWVSGCVTVFLQTISQDWEGLWTSKLAQMWRLVYEDDKILAGKVFDCGKIRKNAQIGQNRQTAKTLFFSLARWCHIHATLDSAEH